MDHKIWQAFWYSLAVMVVGVAATIGVCMTYESNLIAEAVKNGVDPIDARCGILGSSNHARDSVCIVRASAKAK